MITHDFMASLEAYLNEKISPSIRVRYNYSYGHNDIRVDFFEIIIPDDIKGFVYSNIRIHVTIPHGADGEILESHIGSDFDVATPFDNGVGGSCDYTEELNLNSLLQVFPEFDKKTISTLYDLLNRYADEQNEVISINLDIDKIDVAITLDDISFSSPKIDEKFKLEYANLLNEKLNSVTLDMKNVENTYKQVCDILQNIKDDFIEEKVKSVWAYILHETCATARKNIEGYDTWNK